MKTDIKTTLTKDILLKEGDTYFSNYYGEWAKFIGEAILIDDEEKRISALRFESSEPFVIAKIDLTKEWSDFDVKVKAFCDAHPEAFKPTTGRLSIISIK